MLPLSVFISIAHFIFVHYRNSYSYMIDLLYNSHIGEKYNGKEQGLNPGPSGYESDSLPMSCWACYVKEERKEGILLMPTVT